MTSREDDLGESKGGLGVSARQRHCSVLPAYSVRMSLLSVRPCHAQPNEKTWCHDIMAEC